MGTLSTFIVRFSVLLPPKKLSVIVKSGRESCTEDPSENETTWVLLIQLILLLATKPPNVKYVSPPVPVKPPLAALGFVKLTVTERLSVVDAAAGLTTRAALISDRNRQLVRENRCLRRPRS